jgi:hypothetical protein
MNDSVEILSECLEWINGMTDEDRDRLRNPSELDLQHEHFFLGMQVRNSFLWGKSEERLLELKRQLVEKGLIPDTTDHLHADSLSGPLIRWIRSKA